MTKVEARAIDDRGRRPDRATEVGTIRRMLPDRALAAPARVLHDGVMSEKAPARSVLGTELADCSQNAAKTTGFFRDGCCNTSDEDMGSHTVCAQMTQEFLEFSKARGNDLSTPRPEFGFPGLKPGDRWCMCAARYKEALDAGLAPPGFLGATHERAVEVVPYEELKRRALDLN